MSTNYEPAGRELRAPLSRAASHYRDSAELCAAILAAAPCFDRFDICAAYAAIESHYNVGGWLPERASNQRRRESIGCQLHRMKYRPGPLDAELPTINAMAIYRALQVRYGFDPAAD